MRWQFWFWRFWANCWRWVTCCDPACAWGYNTRSSSQLPKDFIFITQPLNQLWTHSKRTKRRLHSFTSGDIFTKPTLNAAQKCEVGSGRRRKSTWAAKEVVERGGKALGHVGNVDLATDFGHYRRILTVGNNGFSCSVHNSWNIMENKFKSGGKDLGKY